METFLQQFRQNIVFFPAPPRAVALNRLREGIYSVWRDSATFGIYGRIEKLHDSDKTSDKSRHAIEMGKETGAYHNGNWRDLGERQRILDELDDEKLFERNRDLSVLLAHITNACSVNEADDLTHRSSVWNGFGLIFSSTTTLLPKGPTSSKLLQSATHRRKGTTLSTRD